MFEGASTRFEKSSHCGKCGGTDRRLLCFGVRLTGWRHFHDNAFHAPPIMGHGRRVTVLRLEVRG